MSEYDIFFVDIKYDHNPLNFMFFFPLAYILTLVMIISIKFLFFFFGSHVLVEIQRL